LVRKSRLWRDSACLRVGGVFIVSKVRVHWFLLRMRFMSLIVEEDPVIS